MKKFLVLTMVFLIIFSKQIQSRHCLDQQQNGKCNKCQSNYHLIKGECSPIIKNCKVYQGNICKVCKNNFVLEDNYCQQKKNDISPAIHKQLNFRKIQLQYNCQQLDTNGNCKKCLEKYHLYQGECYYDIGGCKDYHKGSICKSCQSGFLLMNNYCTSQCGILCNTQFGKSQAIGAQHKHNDSSYCSQFMNGLCIRCIRGYYLNESKCEVDDRSVIQKNNLQNCLVEDRNGRCAKCHFRYYIINGFCKKIQQNCENYLNNGTCLTCYLGYYLSQNNVCQLADPLCRQISPHGLCLSCYGGYSLYNGKCIIQIDQLCISFNQKNRCIQCANRSYLKQGKCQKVDQYCNNYDQISGECKNCYLGYNLVDNKCKLN